MAFTERRVSNSYVSTNPDIPAAQKEIGGLSYQGIVLADESGNEFNATNPVPALIKGEDSSGSVATAKLAKAHDLDSGAGTEYATGVSVRKAASGGSVAMFETAANAGFVNVASSLVPTAYDYISLGYTGSNLTTVIFKTGGSGGSTVATLTLAYTGSRLDSVTKS